MCAFNELVSGLVKILIPFEKPFLYLVTENGNPFAGHSLDTNTKLSTDGINTDQAHPLPLLTVDILEIPEEDLSEYTGRIET